jgi:HPt (histidine-containing phosphotransfer) domain-containing protein
MSTDWPESTPVMDIDAFKDCIGNDAGLILEVIKLFQSDCQRQRDRVYNAAESKDPVELCSAAHAMKGAVSNFSAGPARRAAAALEEMGANGDLSNVTEGCRLLDYELQRLHSALAELSAGGHCGLSTR